MNNEEKKVIHNAVLNLFFTIQIKVDGEKQTHPSYKVYECGG
jgi:hypothetical protein